MTNIIKTNKYQTEVTQELVDTLPTEVFSNLLEYIETVELISTLIDPDVKTIETSDKDENGLVVVDVTRPHMLENMDYFRESALHFQKYGRYTLLTPNAHPKSPYKLHWKEEKKRCLEGLVRPDGEWIPGDLYFYWNYCPIMLTKQVGNTKKALRVKDFPKPWLGDYLFFHYKDQADKAGKHIAVIKMRGVGASFKAGEIGIRRTVLMKNQKTFYTAYDKQFLNQDGVLNKAWNYLDFLAENTPFPRMRLKDSLNRMELRMGYKDLDTNAEKGSKGEIIGISSKDDPDKIRGKRGTIYFEEFGKFPKLSDTWNVCRDSTEDGGVAYDMLVAMGTGGTEGADFQGAEDMIYNPDTYNILGIRNVFDKNASDGKVCFHWGAYLNRNLCYDDNGNPDVIKALIEVLTEFYNIKQTSSDSKALTQRRAEKCITIQDAVMRTDGTLFPVVDLKDYLAEVRVKGIKFFEKHYIVNLILTGGKVKYELTDKFPLRKYKYDVNHKESAIEIFELPKNGSDGLPMRGRYIAGIDPYDDDQGTSLGSIFVFDLINDVIVAEYTGRPKLANDFYEICRRMLMLYNAEGLYEAHPYSQEVKLPGGITKQWGDIQIGDVLFAPNGKTTKVIDIPVNEYMPIYKVTLGDGRIVECSDSHIWSVNRLNSHPNELKNYSTKEMIEIGIKNKHKQNNFFIPNGSSVDYSKQNLPIDAYSMGLILAEGSIRGSHCTKNQVQISSCNEDMDFYKTVVPYEIKKIGTKGYSWSLVTSKCKEIFKTLGLLGSRSETKFIPDIYLYNSIENRLELLKGLMDGDGHACKSGASVYVTSSKILADNVQSLCRSLGFNCNCKKNKTTHLDSYRLLIYTDTIIFKLPRKISDQYVYSPDKKGSKADAYINKTSITNIEFSHYEMGKCVTVDADDGLYMIGDYIVTHNCNKKGLFTYFVQQSSVHLLADAPQTLIDQHMTKVHTNNKRKGIHAILQINRRARLLINDWMITTANSNYQDYDENGNLASNKLNMHLIRSTALLEEAIAWNVDGNFDRISSLGMVMLLREEKKQFLDRIKSNNSPTKSITEDDFFTKEFDDRFSYSESEYE